MSEHSDLFSALHHIEGVSSIEEPKFKKNDEDNYFAFGRFDYVSEADDQPYSFSYGVIRKPITYALSFTINFVYEQLESKVRESKLLKLIDTYNRYSVGIKVHTMPQDRDDELKVALNSEFYLSAENSSLEDNLSQIYVTLRFLENAPAVFSGYLKSSGVKHDYLSLEEQ